MIWNIGFGPAVTHIFDENFFRSKPKTYKMAFPLIHPQSISLNQSLEQRHFMELLFIQEGQTKIEILF